MDDATLGGDGTSRVDVVACYHAHCDARALALPDGLWDLIGQREASLITCHQSAVLEGEA